MTAKPCTQELCSFKKGSAAERFCPVCDECGAAQHRIDEDCVNCNDCLRSEGFIRKGDSTAQKLEITIEKEAEE
jgi:hypothetical protein